MFMKYYSLGKIAIYERLICIKKLPSMEDYYYLDPSDEDSLKIG